MSHTLRDIADRAGVAVSTVSRVLNDPASTGATTPARKRILAVAQELNYQPHAGAQALKRGFTGTVGLLVPNLNADFQAYIQGIENELASHDLRIVPFVTRLSARREKQHLSMLPGRMVDAMIGLHYMAENEPVYRDLRKRGYRLIFRVIDDSLAEVDYDCVGINIGQGAGQLFKHLFQQGYRKIGFVGGLASHDIRDGRFEYGHAQSYKLGHDEVGLAIDPTRAIPVEETQHLAAHTYQAVHAALRENPENFDALIVQANDKLIGTLHAVEELGLSVPGDLGIATIGVESNPECEFLGITLWAQPAEAICTSLAALLTKRLNGEQDGPIEKIYHESKLIVRPSTMRNQTENVIHKRGFSSVGTL